VGGRNGIRPVKTEWWVAGMVICLQQGADLHMAQLMPLPQIGFTFLVPAHLGSPGQRAVKRVCVCVYLLTKKPLCCCHLPNNVENINCRLDIPYTSRCAKRCPPNCPLPWAIWATTKYMIPLVHPSLTPNGTSIGSAVSAGFRLCPDRLTDRRRPK